MGILRDRMERDLRNRGLAKKTIEEYLRAVKLFTAHYMKSPDLLTQEEIKNYQNYLITERKLSPSTVNVQMAAIRFFYQITLGRKWEDNVFPVVKKGKKTPVILNSREIINLFNSSENIKYRTIFLALYSTGLRLNEVIHLKAEDIDSVRSLIHVRHGKRNKERYVILPDYLLQALRNYWIKSDENKTVWLFPGRDSKQPINASTVRTFYNRAIKKTGIKKKVTVHTLRHSFATHLLDMGTNVRIIQILLGHALLSSTLLYTKMIGNRSRKIKTPLDLIAPRLKLI